MTLLAALLAGVAVYLAVGYATGYTPARPRRASKAGPSRRQQWLLQAGVGLTPRQYWSGCVAAGTVMFLIVAAVTATPVVALVPAVAAGLAPHAYHSRQRTLRLREVARAWPEGLRELIASIDVGHSVHQAVCALAAVGPEPLRRAFHRYPLLARMQGTVPALEVVKAELADPTSDRVLEVLILAHERGGRIVTEILDDLATATGKDALTAEEIDTLSLESKINARAVFVLPWLTLLLLCARPGHFRDFYQSGAGLGVVVLAGVLSLAGIALVTRLAREQVEPRVLRGGGAAR